MANRPATAGRVSTKAPDRARPSDVLPYLVVGIGASAGGLHAFTEFLDYTPPDTGMAFVLIQHLDPVHKSLLVSLLAPHTQMTIVEAADGMPLAPNKVFVIPPDATMTIHAGRLVVSSPAPARANRWPIDTFFISLAEDQKHHAVCIVLSGAGSDGSNGLRAVKQHGGLVLAQSQDDAHVVTGMPHSAEATGFVDHHLPVRAMPAQLIEYQHSLDEPAHDSDTGGSHPGDFAEICTVLRQRTGHDFSHYKRPTLLRRIARHMSNVGAKTTGELIQQLKRDPQQVDRLFQDILVSVTQFFRDPGAFQAVATTVLPKILARKEPGESVRLWVPGCASGEEVYSLAILLKEAMDLRGMILKAQIFGTDIDASAITAARAAHYRKPAMARVTPERRAKWFVEEDGFYHPMREIREMCVFSVHSVIKDPPFSKLDMISCRNLLIYLGSELQAPVIRNFHYALNPGGWLFLGPSESVAHTVGLFAPVDKRHRLFERQDAPASLSAPVPRDPAPARPGPATTGPDQITNLGDTLDRSVRRALEQYSPAYVVIDQASHIIRFSGGAVGRYLEPTPGIASLALFGLLRKPLRRAARAAVRKAIAGNVTVVEEGLMLAIEGRPHLVTLITQPIGDGRAVRDRYLVAFHDAGVVRGRTAQATGAADVPGEEAELAQELAATRDQLLATITELETANEELKSFNEEYQSANEELQATNEELETAKEEMQSVNEELQTINTELVTKHDLLTKLNNDFHNLLDSTQIAMVFLDPNLRITRFTPPMTELFHVRASDFGRPLTEIATRLSYPELPMDVADVLATQQTVEREVQIDGDGATFLMQMRPYKTTDRTVDGVVVTFIDISGSKRLQASAALERLNRTLERRVAERTTELEATGRALSQQIKERERAEEMLRQSQKLEAVGKLTGGIAHDFNNLLGVIIGNVEFLMDAVRDDPDHLEQAREILESALSGAELTRRMLAFARKQPLQPQLVDLNTLLPNLVAILRRTLGETIQVTATLAPDLWLTHVDPSQIGDALLNLALNSRDAMPNGGILTIETANIHFDDQSSVENSEIADGDYVALAVTDSGSGMAPEIIERATEPFFTTKPPSAGSGLGLSMIYGFARQSGGHLRIESEVGVGTTVRLYLPRAEDVVATPENASESERPDPRGNETILLVDDNATLRDVTKRHLAALGYDVTTAVGGLAALEILRAGAACDLLLTDVVMPEGMSGYDLVEMAQTLRPGLKILFTTGYAGQQSINGEVHRDRRHMLLKPYRQQDLAKAVRAALDEQ